MFGPVGVVFYFFFGGPLHFRQGTLRRRVSLDTTLGGLPERDYPQANSGRVGYRPTHGARSMK